MDYAPTVDMSSTDRFINRELSWLAFNTRVLEEADNIHHPLLERLRFLSISSANLDEFYMVRVAGLKGQVRADIKTPSDDGLSPAQQLAAINAEARRLIDRQNACWLGLVPLMAKEGIRVVTGEELSAKDRAWLDNHFMENI